MSNSMRKCDRCNRSLKKTAFVSKTEKPTKICCQCQNKDLKNYYTTNSNIQNPIEPKEIKKQLFKYILQIGNDEHMENENLDIEFLCKILTTSLKNKPHELGKAIAEIVESTDRYYYMYVTTNLL
ncbi:10640_t:CDS:2 [Cetraspora pellucida]|uniref:10640_t:CDS:1 n=1 Tax=Cetraspora pellucida TaxID=1433469 RepID=A0A9N9AWN9_9GLOM|nr:10640_t:CDS:2 [Cetraspora pellucida]